MPTCKSCQRAIFWVKMHTGKTMPLDFTPDPERGNVVIDKDGLGTVLSKTAAEQARFANTEAAANGTEQQRLFTSHFATCEFAASHRKLT